MKIKMIALTDLVPSPANVRKTGAMNGIEELAASIEAHGLLQNLQVREAASGKFEVVAGGRRLAALKLLAKRKALAKDAPIGCNVLASDEDASEISLAENEMRQAMHPADQFEAFKALIDAGHGHRGRRGAVRRHADRGAAAPQAGGGQPEAHGALPREGHHARSTHGLHRVGRSRRAGGGMVRGAASWQRSPTRHPANAHRRACARLTTGGRNS